MQIQGHLFGAKIFQLVKIMLSSQRDNEEEFPIAEKALENNK